MTAPSHDENPQTEDRPATGAPSTLRIAMAQVAPILANRERNLPMHLAQIEAAKRQGADLVVFPELSLTGYFVRDMVPDVALDRSSPEISRLVEAASPGAIVAGFVEDSPSHRFYNAAFFAEAGKLVHVHRKVYLPTYGLFDEQRYFAAGNRIQAFDTARFGRVGLLVCEDLWHVSAAMIMQAEEVDILIWVANSPARGVDGPKIRTAETYDQMSRAFAQLLGAVVVLVNRVGFEDGLCFWGGSRVVGPDGSLLAEAPMLDEALTIASIDLAAIRRQRIISPLGRDERLLLTIEELNRIKRRRFESGPESPRKRAP
jgi:predicted amidohydrolase